MFGIFSKGSNREPGFVYDQGVIITLGFAGNEDFGSSRQRQEIEGIEEIKKVLPDSSGIDGHEMGDGEAILYIYGPNADTIFKSIEPVLKNANFNHVDVTLQYGLPDDPNTKEKHFTL